jgi:uncharacterized protein with PQ loop repeat
MAEGDLAAGFQLMIRLIGSILVAASVFFDLFAYWKQIAKTLRERKSKDVSTSAYLMKIVHYLCSIVALVIFVNWAGLIIEAAPLVCCVVVLVVVARYKPKGWRLINFGK